MLSLLIFLAFSWAQIIEPVRSLHLPSDQLFASANENAFLSKAYEGADELQLFQRGLDDQKNNKDAEQCPAFDVRKAISSIGQIKPVMTKPIGATLSKIMNTFGESTVSELFGYIRNLVRNPDLIKQQSSRVSFTSSDTFENNFTRGALLAAVGELSNESVVKGKQFLEQLKKNFKNTEMEALFTNIMTLLENQPTLQKFAELSANVDKAFGLDKPSNLDSFGLPVPTKENPVVYFQLKDDSNPSIKFFVKVKLEDDQYEETILIKTDEFGGHTSTQNTYTASNDDGGLAELYKKLPISKVVKH